MQENKLLLLCARTQLTPQQNNELEVLLKQPLDWQHILDQSATHRLTPLLFYHLKNLELPPHIYTILEKTYTYTAFHNMVYLAELNTILDQGIKIIVLKGPHLAETVYGNIALRPFSDMDLLIQRADIEKLDQKLIKLGYISSDKSFYKNCHFHLPYTKKGKVNIHLEIHWAFVDKFILHRIDMDKILAATTDKYLPCELNILYLILHLEKHAFFNKLIFQTKRPQEWIFTKPLGNQLLWYTDLYELISKNNPDWKKIVTLSKEWKIEQILYRNIIILNNLYPDLHLETILAQVPIYKLGRIKKTLYSLAAKKTDLSNINQDMQLRPARIIDLLNYLFPNRHTLRDYYSQQGNLPVIICYLKHLAFGFRELLHEFRGLCQKYL